MTMTKLSPATMADVRGNATGNNTWLYADMAVSAGVPTVIVTTTHVSKTGRVLVLGSCGAVKLNIGGTLFLRIRKSNYSNDGLLADVSGMTSHADYSYVSCMAVYSADVGVEQEYGVYVEAPKDRDATVESYAPRHILVIDI